MKCSATPDQSNFEEERNRKHNKVRTGSPRRAALVLRHVLELCARLDGADVMQELIAKRGRPRGPVGQNPGGSRLQCVPFVENLAHHFCSASHVK